MKFQYVVVALSVLATAPASALDLKSYMDQVVQKHRGLESLRVSKEGSEDKQEAGDIDLVPVLSLKGGYLSDKKQPQMIGTEAQATEYSLGLSKKFSTGTQVALNGKAGAYKNLGLFNPAFASYAEYGQGTLGVSISQSLWKDAFGQSTRLRRTRESATAAAEVGNFDLQSRQILAEAESTFWENIYLQEEVSVRQSTLDRALKIENWMTRRKGDGIADNADLLGAQALAAGRRLELSIAQDDLIAAQKKLRDALELGESDALPALTADMKSPRDLKQLMASSNEGAGSGKIMRLDAYLAQLESKVRETSALEAADRVAADLSLSGSYATNSYANPGGVSDATKNLSKTDTPTASVALTWTYLFDTDVKDAAIGSARKMAMASKLLAERKALESQTAWNEMNRRHAELTKKIEAAALVRRLQVERAKAEALKLSRGRSVTSNVINSEQDAAEAELRWVRLQSEQRKLESQARLFVEIKE